MIHPVPELPGAEFWQAVGRQFGIKLFTAQPDESLAAIGIKLRPSPEVIRLQGGLFNGRCGVHGGHIGAFGNSVTS